MRPDIRAFEENHPDNARISVTTNSQKIRFCPDFCPDFLIKIRPDSAWILTKMSPDEELVTLHSIPEYQLRRHVTPN